MRVSRGRIRAIITNLSNDITQAPVARSNVATPSPSAPSSSTAGVGATARSSGSSAAAASQGSDQATIGSVSGVLATALNGSDVRTAKVAALRESLPTGTGDIAPPR